MITRSVPSSSAAPCAVARGDKNDKSEIQAHLTVTISARYSKRHMKFEYIFLHVDKRLNRNTRQFEQQHER